MVCFSYIGNDQFTGVVETASGAGPTLSADSNRRTEGSSFPPSSESGHRATSGGKQVFQQNNISVPLHFGTTDQTTSNQFRDNLQNFTNYPQTFVDNSNNFMNTSHKSADNLQNYTNLSQNFNSESFNTIESSPNFRNNSSQNFPNIRIDQSQNSLYTDMNALPDHMDGSVFDNICFDAGYDSDDRHQGVPTQRLVDPQDDLEDSSQDLGDSQEGSRVPQEDLEESPILRMLESGCDVSTDRVIDAFPFMTRDSLFEVVLKKSSRGLGLSVVGGVERPGPLCGLVRISRLHPQLPAALSQSLLLGDVLLEANRTSLAGLSCHEALEVIRTSKESSVRLLLCRPPEGSMVPSVEQRPVETYKRMSNTYNLLACSNKNYLASPVHSLYGEIELTLTKVNKSLGFSLCKRDNSVLGHTIRALVRPPALTDGRIKAGDKVLSVNGHDMCGLSHEEAIAFLRTTGESVVIRLYRDFSQTPVSPSSPVESYEQLLRAPKPLRQEARDMLSELAFRKKSNPGMTMDSNGSGASTGRRRRRQKTPEPTTTNPAIVDKKNVVVDRFESLVRRMDEDAANSRNITEIYNSTDSEFNNKKSFNGSVSSSDQSTLVSRNSSDASSIFDNKSLSNSPLDGAIQRTRPSFLDLGSPHSCARKCQFTPPHEANSMSPFEQYFSETEDSKHFLSMGSVDSEPCDNAYRDADFQRIQPSYQSMNFAPSSSPSNDNKISNTASSDDVVKFSMPQNDNFSSDNTKKGLMKWKGSVLPPEKELSHMNSSPTANFSSKSLELVESVICLHRGWNTRLGFSVKEVGNEVAGRSKTRVVAIYSGCAAAKDGRLRIGDFLIKVNEEDVSQWDTDTVIDVLRKCQGRIELTVLQTPF